PYLIKAIQGQSKETKRPTKADQRDRFGEDSWFVSSTPKAEVIGVADGVGGWRHAGIDSGAFARELMYWCRSNALRADFDGKDMRQLLVKSFAQMKRQSKNVWGSSTACLVALNRSDCTLHTANLGDSGFLVLRDNRVVLKSDEQQHEFNTPFQLSVPPNAHSASVYCDDPELATATQMPLQAGDLVLLATDGLFDNVPENMLVRVLKSVCGVTCRRQLQMVADGLVEWANELSHDTSYQSPFSLKARANNFDYSSGGKPDDITVILATVAVESD
ncbi:hypothetical protein KR222_002489, partial [Zaprionus bogoriensis]